MRRCSRASTTANSPRSPTHSRSATAPCGNRSGNGCGTCEARIMGDVSNGPKRVTMAEVAAAAQVSVPTVSKVLNGRSDVAPETRSRVQAVFDRYGYRPSASPRTRRSGLIDLVFTDLSPWSIEIIQGAEHAALE